MASRSLFPYNLLPSEGETLESGASLLFDSPNEKPSRYQCRLTNFMAWIKYLSLGSAFLASLSMFLLGLRWQLNADYMCMQRSTVWSPIWEEVDPAYIHVKFNGTLDAPSEWRGPPSEMVDKAWSRLDDFGSMSFDEKTFLRAGGTKKNARFPKELGGGYMADIEVLHQMHCLNFVRMAAYSDHYEAFAPEWQDSERTFHIHLDHCIEMIRTNLLCQADSGVIPFRWVDGYQRPLPDFSTPHKCRNWESVLEWASKRQVRVPTGYQWKHQDWEEVFPRPEWMPPP